MPLGSVVRISEEEQLLTYAILKNRRQKLFFLTLEQIDFPIFSSDTFPNREFFPIFRKNNFGVFEKVPSLCGGLSVYVEIK